MEITVGTDLAQLASSEIQQWRRQQRLVLGQDFGLSPSPGEPSVTCASRLSPASEASLDSRIRGCLTELLQDGKAVLADVCETSPLFQLAIYFQVVAYLHKLQVEADVQYLLKTHPPIVVAQGVVQRAGGEPYQSPIVRAVVGEEMVVALISSTFTIPWQFPVFLQSFIDKQLPA